MISTLCWWCCLSKPILCSKSVMIEILELIPYKNSPKCIIKHSDLLLHSCIWFQNSYWFDCSCSACNNNYPCVNKLPREYLKLAGSHFKYKRCNRKELQKDVDKLKKRIRQTILDEKVPVTMEVPNHYEATRLMFHDWMNLLDELLVPGSHQVGLKVL